MWELCLVLQEVKGESQSGREGYGGDYGGGAWVSRDSTRSEGWVLYEREGEEGQVWEQLSFVSLKICKLEGHSPMCYGSLIIWSSKTSFGLNIFFIITY